MKVAYFDCFSGVAGDMVLGALLDLGINHQQFIKQIQTLAIDSYTIRIEPTHHEQIKATNVFIDVLEKHQPHRTFCDIKQIILNSAFPKPVQNTSIKIFSRLAQAEAKVHDIPVEKVHFHEVGAVDSIVDIVGCALGLHLLSIEEIISSPLPLGTGFIQCAHGTLPVPVPATMELVQHIPIYQTKRKQELVTPTGAAIITTLANNFGPLPSMKVSKVGYGAGKTKSNYPNLLRVILGEKEEKKI